MDNYGLNLINFLYNTIWYICIFETAEIMQRNADMSILHRKAWSKISYKCHTEYTVSFTASVLCLHSLFQAGQLNQQNNALRLSSSKKQNKKKELDCNV